jgi:Raf kinase inhibitor-like YbhB/YbcL family protein
MSQLDRPIAPNPYDHLPVLPSFTVTSDDITDGGPLKDDQAQAHGNSSPQLSWSGAPEGTRSYTITCFDPDAPTPSGFWHWVLVDVPADVTSLPAGLAAADADLPGKAFHVRNDYGTADFGGAAPPEGDHPHRYFFSVYAVGEESLGVEDSVSPAVVAFNLVFKAVARGAIVGTYQV